MKTANFFKMMMLFLAIGIMSCDSNETDDGGGDNGGGGGNGNLTLSVDTSRVFNNSLVTFTVTDAGGANVTSQSVITVDGTPISGNSSLMSGVGVKNAQATYNSETSNTVQVEVIAPSYTTKMLIEDYTGAWCPWCPRISNAIEELQATADGSRYVSVAIHNGDTMAFPQESQMRSQFGVTGFPTGILNRDARWSSVSGSDMNLTQATNILNVTKSVGLAIDSSVSGNTVNATIKVGFDLDNSGVELVAYLLQNGVVENQANNTSHYGGPGWINGYSHKDILRASFTDLFGDAIPADQQVGGNEYSVDLSASFNGVNASDWDIVAFAIDSTGKVINAQRADVGQDKDFD